MGVLTLLLLAPQGVAAWDTGQPSDAPLAPEALAARAGWAELARGAAAEFKGDAVVTNGRLTLAARRRGAGVDVYGAGPARFRLAVLAEGGAPGVRLEKLSLAENARGGVALEAAYATGKGSSVSARFRLKRGDGSVEVEPGAGAAAVRVECASRLVVLPDFFADDMILDARRVPLAAVEVPSENFLVLPAGREDALVTAVFEDRGQDVRVNLAGEGEARGVVSCDIAGGPGKKVWASLLEAPRVWHAFEVKPEDAGKVRPLEWTMPFPAHWRCDLTRADGLVDTWDVLLQEKEGGPFLKPSWMGQGPEQLKPNRERWTTVLGRFAYPCWTDPRGRGFLQPLKHRALSFAGPALIYPVNRVTATPPETYTVVDVMRNTLGVGPCEYILDVGGQKPENRGRATCNVRDTLTKIYSEGRQKEQRQEVEKVVDAGLVFVEHIRGRITRYREFLRQVRALLDERAKAQPELKARLEELDAIARLGEEKYAAREEKMKTPAHVAAMNEEFKKTLLGHDGPDALDRVKKYARDLVVIGDNQDELSGELRWVLRALRQKAGLLMALDPAAAKVAGEVRAKTQEVLRNPAGHEGARH
jgi:hypothetical protein